jgi:hypothetical protein
LHKAAGGRLPNRVYLHQKSNSGNSIFSSSSKAKHKGRRVDVGSKFIVAKARGEVISLALISVFCSRPAF